MKIFRPVFFALGLLCGAQPAFAGPLSVDAATRHAVVAKLAVELRDRYVFPDRAASAASQLLAADRAGKFDAMTDPDEFAKAVTGVLAESLHDKHLHLSYSADALPPQHDHKPSPQQIAQIRAFYQSVNYGIEKVVRLPANIGYLDVRGFPPAAPMGAPLMAAMNLLSHTDALIIDVRNNGGGHPEGVALLCSYLFSQSHPVHLNDIFGRTPKTATGKIDHYWTKRVAGATYAMNKPVYVLTSADTFSGGEEFAYDMQTQKRATLVGQTTGGGANPGGDIRLSDHFEAFIPDGRAINPITHTNWEGTGVVPDIATKADAALSTAYLALLQKKLATITDPDMRKEMQTLIDRITKDPGSVLSQ